MTTYETYGPAPWIKVDRYGITKTLPPETSVIWYKALLLCANGDGELAQAERDWVIGHATTYHPEMSESQIDELRTYNGTGSTDDIEKLVFSDPLAKKGRYVLVYEAIQASAADGDYSEGEKATIRKMGAKLGISEAKIIELESLFEEEKALREKRIKVWHPEGIPGEDK
ncbi:MAG: TerB family tellurite resistance protein [Microcoleaceae cyanobacterium]